MANLGRAADRLADQGIDVMIEPINTRVDVPGYLLDSTALALECIERTGRRNVRLGLLALGVRREDVDEQAEAVIEWIELGEAIDRPLRTYSSGMRARLHFAIATSVSPRILLVDEALGVGDKNFRAKSTARMREIQASAGVLMVVNHSMAELAASCERGIWIQDGVIVRDGPIDDVIAAYDAS